MFKQKKPIVTLVLSVLLLAIVGFLLPGASIPPVAADTYDVTSTSCTGPGSITAAMDMANANPGIDIISIAPGLQIDARECPPTDAPPNPNDYYALQATESVIFEGNGAKLTGSNTWINDNGTFVQHAYCFDEQPPALLLSQSPGFIRVGVPKADNSAITVTVRDLEFDNLSGMALLEENASFVLEDARVLNLVPSTRNCDQSIIVASEGANVTLTGNYWFRNTVHSPVLFGTAFNGVISGENAGNLTIEDSEFLDNGYSGMISWRGQAGSMVNIVSSRFEDTGGIAVEGAATSNIVNSIWASSTLFNPDADDRTSNASSEDMNIIASTFLFSNVACDAQCQSTKLDGGSNLGWLVRLGDGNINFVQSAVEVATPDYKTIDETYVRLLEYDLREPASGFSADGATWMRPTAIQDADALKVVTGQPDLLTAQPAFSSPGLLTSFAEWATPLVPGELIDRIEDAACDQDNKLLNPVDGECITVDALGNPRVDGNGKRNIGAVQLNEAPHLVVSGTGDGTVDLSWTKPRNPSATIQGYLLQYRAKGTTAWTDMLVAGGDTLTGQVTGLTNGTEYEFQVDSLIGDMSPGSPAGYPSNVVTATPYGPIGAPVVTATPGDGEVALSWTQPALGGREFSAYSILWRVAGTDEFTGAQATYSYDATTATVTGLKNGTTYEFAVAASAGGDVGPQGLATATPVKPVEPPQPGEEDCTLSSGYWSTHSEYGPSLYDATWAQLPNGADTPFFLSGQSYYEVINADPEGNTYYILAQQYIAAELNFLRGAEPADAQAAFDAAKVLFENYTPDQAAALKGLDRKAWTDLASALDAYNNGYIGPGYCTE